MIVPGVFLAIGLGVLGVDWFPHHLLISQVSLGLVGLLCVVKFVGHAIESDGNLAARFVFATICCAVFVMVTSWTESAIQRHKTSPEIAATPGPGPTPTTAAPMPRPSKAKLHSHAPTPSGSLQIGSIAPIQGESEIAEGKKIGFNYQIENPTDSLVYAPRNFAAISIALPSELQSIQHDFDEKQKKAHADSVGSYSAPIGAHQNNFYNSVEIVLRDIDVQYIKEDKAHIYLQIWLGWKGGVPYKQCWMVRPTSSEMTNSSLTFKSCE